jgi:hypothetical protein
MQLLRLLVVLAKLAQAPVLVQLLQAIHGAMHQRQWHQSQLLMMHGQTQALLQWATTPLSKFSNLIFFRRKTNGSIKE